MYDLHRQFFKFLMLFYYNSRYSIRSYSTESKQRALFVVNESVKSIHRCKTSSICTHVKRVRAKIVMHA